MVKKIPSKKIIGGAAGAVAGAVIGTYAGTAGREYDEETGLYYYRARYYDSKIGRFLQVDPDAGKMSNPITHINKYVYVGNNPQNMIDPSGRSLKKTWRNIKDYSTDKFNNFKSNLKDFSRSPEGKVFLTAGLILGAAALSGPVAEVALLGAVSGATVGALHALYKQSKGEEVDFWGNVTSSAFVGAFTGVGAGAGFVVGGAGGAVAGAVIGTYAGTAFNRRIHGASTSDALTPNWEQLGLSAFTSGVVSYFSGPGSDGGSSNTTSSGGNSGGTTYIPGD